MPHQNYSQQSVLIFISAMVIQILKHDKASTIQVQMYNNTYEKN